MRKFEVVSTCPVLQKWVNPVKSLGSMIFTQSAGMNADYRGEVKVIIANLGSEPFEIARGERIAQLVPSPVLRAAFAEVETLDDTVRGAGGFGSTGQ